METTDCLVAIVFMRQIELLQVLCVSIM